MFRKKQNDEMMEKLNERIKELEKQNTKLKEEVGTLIKVKMSCEDIIISLENKNKELLKKLRK